MNMEMIRWALRGEDGRFELQTDKSTLSLAEITSSDAGNRINDDKLFPLPVRVRLSRVLSDVRRLFLAEQLVMKIWTHSIGGGC